MVAGYGIGTRLEYGNASCVLGDCAMKRIFLDYALETDEDVLRWKLMEEEEYDSVNSLEFNSFITALFTLRDELFVATENGGLYRIDGIALGSAAVSITSCEIVEIGTEHYSSNREIR